MYIASIMPLTALCFIFLLYVFGANDWLSIVIVGAGTLMFAIAVIWWWWAMITMRLLSKKRLVTIDTLLKIVLYRNKKLEKIQKELEEIKKITKDT
jgi:hypothetical protein